MFDLHIHSFVVKIWLEESAQEGGRAIWRGRITHVPSGAYAYVQELEQLLHFITPYLKEMGVECSSGSTETQA